MRILSRASGKTGMGVEEILKAVVVIYPAPDGRRRGAATGFDFRLGIQFFPWNHRVF